MHSEEAPRIEEDQIARHRQGIFKRKQPSLPGVKYPNPRKGRFMDKRTFVTEQVYELAYKLDGLDFDLTKANYFLDELYPHIEHHTTDVIRAAFKAAQARCTRGILLQSRPTVMDIIHGCEQELHFLQL